MNMNCDMIPVKVCAEDVGKSWGVGATSQQQLDELKKAGKNEVTLHNNSPEIEIAEAAVEASLYPKNR